ncbi:fumarate reductase flavoprotein subunit [Oceanidesulfovibrio marinus]|uniref:succinate dehydrogenase n=1 Tax=Oceanidesulfovibrio marinus TaxID=370038 RepID=A0A6P1ZEP4_9BACT|nr:fumarate reductase flavoprotein subunit [Oceanidesulfovibrio marinus]QJT09660.1 fumarate reductase flavoprotein subunit [Oceanidesulfovibrio marinus]TVM31022.1 fumarate reductase flavoprotein subunit [Oceanidesulfovibrio marinus]
MLTFYTDLLCIGAGLAGERCAVEAAGAGFEVVCLSLVPARRSHSCCAQGGMQAALGNCAMGEGDCPDIHFQDTVKGSDWGADQEVAWLFAEAAPVEMRRLAHWGVPWNRVEPGVHTYYKGGKPFEKEELEENRGLIHARAFGGTAKWRTCYASDGTGHSVLYTMDNRAAQLGVQVHDRTEVISLIHDDGNCLGAVARSLRTGELVVYMARATLIASGGFGRIYRNSTNAVINDGGAHIAALDTGVVPLGNMEAVQFHPTGIVPTDILVTEGCRGDGGTLLDKDLHRFMPDYEPEKAELASRDVVSRRMTEHMRKGKGVPSPYGDHLWLDIRHLGEKHIRTKLREVDEICQYFLGIDPVKSLIPVRPTQHYSMGGIRTNKDGAAYGLSGLFSAGESACWDMHGFNRLGGNSLAETVVAGGIVGKKIVEFLKGSEVSFPTGIVREQVTKDRERIDALIKGEHGHENVYDVREAMFDVLEYAAGIYRNGDDLERGVGELQEIHERANRIGLKTNGLGANPELALALKMPGMVRLALCVTYGALMRTESRGSHTREDYPERNDRDWLSRTLATWKEGASLPNLTYEDASPVYTLPPGDRGYGGGKIIPRDAAKEDK